MVGLGCDFLSLCVALSPLTYHILFPRDAGSTSGTPCCFWLNVCSQITSASWLPAERRIPLKLQEATNSRRLKTNSGEAEKVLSFNSGGMKTTEWVKEKVKSQNHYRVWAYKPREENLCSDWGLKVMSSSAAFMSRCVWGQVLSVQLSSPGSRFTGYFCKRRS